VSIASLSWVLTSYAVLFAALFAPAGRVADIVGQRRLFRLGLSGFVATSAASALAPSLAVLVAARALQGGSAALMIPAALGLVLTESAPARRAAAIGAWASAGAIAAAAGPSLGGVLVDAAGWRTVFLINVPLGLGLLALTRRIPDRASSGGLPPDPLSVLLLAAGVGGLVLGVTQAQAWGWTSARTAAVVAVALLALSVSLARSARIDVPALDTSLWQSRPCAVANAASLLLGASMYAFMLLGVLWLTNVWHYSEIKAGLAISPSALTAAATSFAIGKHPSRHGPRAAVAVGAALMAGTGAWMALALGPQPAFLTLWLGGGLVSGVGIGAAMTGLATAAALSAPPEKFATATGLNMTARQVGGALGVAGLAAILTGAGSFGPFLHVYWMCAAFAAAGALAAGFLGSSPAPVAAAGPGDYAAEQGTVRRAVSSAR
jgi:EmrB/QacA subfamily drug resistance transporter